MILLVPNSKSFNVHKLRNQMMMLGCDENTEKAVGCDQSLNLNDDCH